MINRTRLRFLQIFLFIFATLLACLAGSYFPNLPPSLRLFLPKGIQGKMQLTKSSPPDARFMKWFNRDPERVIPTATNIVVAPADGLVWNIRQHEQMKHIVIEMRYTDVHVQRFPIGGEIISIEGKGKKLKADALIKDYMLEKMLPFQKVTTIHTDIGIVRIRQITSFFAERIQVYHEIGDRVEIGERLGKSADAVGHLLSRAMVALTNTFWTM